MRTAFAHDAVLLMAPDADIRAPGGAITVALCGHWNHEPPCPLAPHHTHAAWVKGKVYLRILFACEPEQEAVVRQHIDRGLAEGQLRGPDDVLSVWRVHTSTPSAVAPQEVGPVERLIHN